MKRSVALILAVLLLSGCGGRETPVETGAVAESVPMTAAETTELPSGIRHADVRFRDMAYEHYEAEWFDEFTAPIYRLAEQGGGAAEFDEADLALTDELYYVHTLLTLAGLKHSADPADTAAAAEYLYAQELYSSLEDAYWRAMRALAVSPYKWLIDEVWGTGWAAEFAAYEGYGEDGFHLSQQENALISEYYGLMAQEEPDTDAVAYVFLQLVELRNALAELYGYESYADYAYAEIYCRDYAPDDAELIWRGAKEFFVPLARDYAAAVEDAAALLQSDEELDCDPDAILDAMGRVLPELSAELSAAFAYLLEYGLYDIAPDARKAAVGYTDYLYYYEEPFIFNCPYGEFYDYLDMIHEFGHWCNYFFCGSDLLFGWSDYDLAELQSQGMELLFTRCYDEIFGEYADGARGYVLMDMVYSVIDGAMYDEFLRRVYAEPELTAERMNGIFAELYRAYGYTPYEGYETAWMGVSHNFDDPFYYISYAVSALGALELYSRFTADWDAAADTYLTICAADTEYYYLSEVLEEAGLGNIFAAGACEAIVAPLEAEFAALL